MIVQCPQHCLWDGGIVEKTHSRRRVESCLLRTNLTPARTTADRPVIARIDGLYATHKTETRRTRTYNMVAAVFEVDDLLTTRAELIVQATSLTGNRLQSAVIADGSSIFVELQSQSMAQLHRQDGLEVHGVEHSSAETGWPGVVVRECLLEQAPDALGADERTSSFRLRYNFRHPRAFVGCVLVFATRLALPISTVGVFVDGEWRHGGSTSLLGCVDRRESREKESVA